MESTATNTTHLGSMTTQFGSMIICTSGDVKQNQKHDNIKIDVKIDNNNNNNNMSGMKLNDNSKNQGNDDVSIVLFGELMKTVMGSTSSGADFLSALRRIRRIVGAVKTSDAHRKYFVQNDELTMKLLSIIGDPLVSDDILSEVLWCLCNLAVCDNPPVTSWILKDVKHLDLFEKIANTRVKIGSPMVLSNFISLFHNLAADKEYGLAILSRPGITARIFDCALSTKSGDAERQDALATLANFVRREDGDDPFSKNHFEMARSISAIGFQCLYRQNPIDVVKGLNILDNVARNIQTHKFVMDQPTFMPQIVSCPFVVTLFI